MPRMPLISASQSAMRMPRLTGRSAGARAPRSAAITGATAPVSPLIAHKIRPNSATASAEAANCASPSRAMKITSTA